MTLPLFYLNLRDSKRKRRQVGGGGLPAAFVSLPVDKSNEEEKGEKKRKGKDSRERLKEKREKDPLRRRRKGGVKRKGEKKRKGEPGARPLLFTTQRGGGERERRGRERKGEERGEEGFLNQYPNLLNDAKRGKGGRKKKKVTGRQGTRGRISNQWTLIPEQRGKLRGKGREES